MKPTLALSTRELMRLVLVAAANLLLFKGAGIMLIYAPVALAAVILNLALFCTFVRPRTLNRGIVAAIAGGVAVLIAALDYMVDSRFQPRMAVALLDALPRSIYDALPVWVRSASWVRFLEFALIDGIGIAAMLLCGWLAWPRRPARP